MGVLDEGSLCRGSVRFPMPDGSDRMTMTTARISRFEEWHDMEVTMIATAISNHDNESIILI